LPSLIFPASPSSRGASNASTRTTTSDETSVSPTTITRFPVNIQPRTSTLTVMTQTIESPQSHRIPSSGPSTLAALQTSSPSCPACRGPVRILFTRESPTPRSTGKASRHLADASLNVVFLQRWLKVYSRMQGFAKGWWKECGASVTGRSLMVRLAAQYSFLIVLVSMIKASGRGTVRKWFVHLDSFILVILNLNLDFILKCPSHTLYELIKDLLTGLSYIDAWKKLTSDGDLDFDTRFKRDRSL
jgi:hypothetical protein